MRRRTPPVSDGPSAAMLEGIVGLARKLRLDVTAEGTEDQQQLAALRGLDCRMGQGFLLVRPGPPPVIEALLASRARRRPASGTLASPDGA